MEHPLVLIGVIILSSFVTIVCLVFWDFHKRDQGPDKKMREVFDKEIDYQKEKLENPYRTKQEVPEEEEDFCSPPAEESEPPPEPEPAPKVFCKDCKHLQWVYPLTKSKPVCLTGDLIYHPVHGPTKQLEKADRKNKNFNCPDFELVKKVIRF